VERSRVYTIRFGSGYTLEVVLAGGGLSINVNRECRHKYCTYTFTESALRLMKAAGWADKCVVIIRSQGVPVKQVRCDWFAEIVEELNAEVE
jgi:hypothetical protein